MDLPNLAIPIREKLCPTCSCGFSATEDVNLCPNDQTPLSLVPADPFIGTVIAGRYRIIEAVGSGGWSTVYRALHEQLNRTVAVKVLGLHLAYKPEGIKRFQREAEAASSLMHPNVATIFDYGVLPQGQPYIVMEFLEGQNLAHTLKEHGALDLKLALPIFIQCCAGLAAAHKKGIIHRDIKPANIFILKSQDKTPQVKILDFGLAKLADSSGDGDLTATGQALGTPAYMSPEQCRHGSVNSRTDIYSLGVVMYECLTAPKANKGTSFFELVNAKLACGSPANAQREGSLQEDIRFIVTKAMSKELKDRYQTIEELKESLDQAQLRLLTGTSSSPNEVGLIKSKRNNTFGTITSFSARLAALIAYLLVANLVALGTKAWFDSRHGADIMKPNELQNQSSDSKNVPKATGVSTELGSQATAFVDVSHQSDEKAASPYEDYGPVVRRAHKYDNKGKLATATLYHGNQAGKIVGCTEIAYAENGKPVSETHHYYDPTGQLISHDLVKEFGSNGNLIHSREFVYDAVKGNIIKGRGRFYDANGRLTRETRGTYDPNDSHTTSWADKSYGPDGHPTISSNWP